MSTSYKYFEPNECSIVNISYTPNETDFSWLHFGQINEEEFGVLIYVENLVASQEYAKNTVILTFFGYVNYPDEAEGYLPRNATQEVLGKPFEVYVVFPDSFTMHSDTFPPPLTTFTTRQDRLAFWSLNFTYPPPGHAQSVSCSFVSQSQLQLKSPLTFLSSILIPAGLSLFLNGLRRNRRSRPIPAEGGQGNREPRNSKRAKIHLLLVAIPVVNVAYLSYMSRRTRFTSSRLLTLVTAGASIALLAGIVFGLLSYFRMTVQLSQILIEFKPGAKIPLFDILRTIAGVSATIFAIAFGLSQFVVPSIADKYSPRMLEFFERGRKYWLAYLLIFLSVLFSIAFLAFADALVGTVAFSVFVLIILLFYESLIALSFYFSYVFEVANPLEFCTSIESQIIASLGSHMVKTGSSALADSAIKALNRGGEEENVKAFLDSLQRIFMALIKPGHVDRESESEFVLDQIVRVHDTAHKRKETNVTSHIFQIMHNIGEELVGRSA